MSTFAAASVLMRFVSRPTPAGSVRVPLEPAVVVVEDPAAHHVDDGHVVATRAAGAVLVVAEDLVVAGVSVLRVQVVGARAADDQVGAGVAPDGVVALA